ncbi:MAG TPA: Crp/Fnr family transcriptional regulator [Brevundimonas sp.]|nr:Crp/Fnr family transcriptional regulator [Brevundimonas sp.]
MLRNHLLDRLSPEDRAAVLSASTPFEFELGHVFSEAGDTVVHVHFVLSGIISAVAGMQDGRTVETFMVGREGVTTPGAINVPVRTYSRLVGQSTGETRRIEVGRLRALCDERPELRSVIALYAAGLQGELEQSGACNALHRADQRFAKWLLRCHDRLDGDTLHLTQEYLASLLGSQRTTVNEAAQGLQKAGAISYSRGRVTILDRSALERAACECYTAGRRDILDIPRQL